VTALIGTAPRSNAPARPTLIRSMSEFDQSFGDPAAPVTHLALAVWGFLDNGGQEAIIVNRDAEAGPITAEDLAPLASFPQIALVAAPGITDAASHDALITHCEASGDRFAVLDMPQTVPNIAALTTAAPDGNRPRQSDGGFAAVYAPWIELPARPGTGVPVPCPPSGHICGIYARIDATHGVHKAPANTPIYGSLRPTRSFTRDEMAQLTAAHVNPLRVLPHGFRVWGARTLAGSAGEYRYMTVRRIALMLRQSIRDGTDWASAEPNGPALWDALEQSVEAFLVDQWRRGVFYGSTPREAFFVRCDASKTSQADMDAQRAHVLVGFAPLKPSELVLLQIEVTTA
jgi:phage tail sheath protein FI